MVKQKPLYLVSNDDGFDAEGLNILAQELSAIADVVICAPKTEQSGQSQAITLTQPLRLHEISENVFAVEGTPADCVMLALQHLLEKKPDWVISGINRGGNLGTDVLYSGTVGAALEGALNGCKALAVSLEGIKQDDTNHYQTAAYLVKQILQHESELALEPGQIINLNVPNFPFEEIRGVKTASLGRRIYEGKMWERTDPRGGRYYWIGSGGYGYEEIPGSDCVILNEGYATISVLQASLYHEAATHRLADLSHRLWPKG